RRIFRRPAQGACDGAGISLRTGTVLTISLACVSQKIQWCTIRYAAVYVARIMRGVMGNAVQSKQGRLAMTEKIQFPTWTFEPDLHEAWHRETGEAIQFTRAERALLNAFIESSGRGLQRDILLDAVAGLDAEVADRSIDFIIHRLRRKLRDKARDPRYIATQYGEGYVWVAEPVATQPPAAGAFLVVGPVRGLDFATQLADRGRLFARALAREIDR